VRPCQDSLILPQLKSSIRGDTGIERALQSETHFHFLSRWRFAHFVPDVGILLKGLVPSWVGHGSFEFAHGFVNKSFFWRFEWFRAHAWGETPLVAHVVGLDFASAETTKRHWVVSVWLFNIVPVREETLEKSLSLRFQTPFGRILVHNLEIVVSLSVIRLISSIWNSHSPFVWSCH